MNIQVFPPEMQGVGAFDGGRITEQKPIGFPGEGSAIKRVGPLFYWAWARAAEEGYIPEHPHKAFEIMTYVVSGMAEHGDSLGTNSRVSAGGAQVMQTGSGCTHRERFIGPDMEGFQIWFEPYLNDAIKRTPTYNEYQHEHFPISSNAGVSVKTVIGEGAPIQLVTEAKMWDVEIEPGKSYRQTVQAGHSLTALAIRGEGEWSIEGAGETAAFAHKTFTILEEDAGTDSEVTAVAAGDEKARLILIEVPTTVDYPLYRKG